jgi:hypothetical protein
LTHKALLLISIPDHPVTKIVKGLISSGSEDVWLGAKFPKNQLQIKTSTGNSETWEDYNGWSSWRNGITPARGISSERRLLMKGDSNNLGDWVVWNGNEKKGFVCQYKKNACKTGWDEDTTSNKCLKAFTGDDNMMTWQNAQRKCEEQGLNGNLASLIAEDSVKSLVQTLASASSSLAATTTFEAYWLGGSVQYNGVSLTYTWTDGTSNEVDARAWAAGYNVPTTWTTTYQTYHTYINNDRKIGLNTGDDRTNFICQYDVPLTAAQQLLAAGMFGGGRKRSLF